MTDAKPNGHAWLQSSVDARHTYLSGFVHGLQQSTATFEAAIEVNMMVGLNLPKGVDAKEIVEWAGRIKANVGLPPELSTTTVPQLADALDQIYADKRNLDILIASALPAALAIANGSSEGPIRERLERIRTTAASTR